MEELEAELSLLGAVDPVEFMSVDEVPVVLEGVVVEVLLEFTPEAAAAPL